MNAQKDQFNTQGIASLLWAMAKLMDNGQEQTPELKEALAALLPHVNAQKDQFIPQHIANLLWAMAKLGELVELNVVTSTFESLVHRISSNPELSQQEIFMSLWGVMVCCARLSLVSNANKNNWLEKHMDDLFTRLENTSPKNAEDQSHHCHGRKLAWQSVPGRPPLPDNHVKTSNRLPRSTSIMHSIFAELKKTRCLNSLPPVDLLLPDHNMVIEVQGPSHYLSGDFKTRNGSTLLKIALLAKIRI